MAGAYAPKGDVAIICRPETVLLDDGDRSEKDRIRSIILAA